MRYMRFNLISCLTLIALLAILVGCGDEETSKATDAQSSDATGDASNGGDGNSNNADGKIDGDGQDSVDGASTPCDDKNSCTVDIVNPDGTCSYSQRGDGEACDDGNKCSTGDLCISGMCTGSGSAYCGDGNDCTTDACDPLQTGDGCKHINNLLPCDDGDACTTGDKCTAGACVPGSSKKDCDDKDACTTDTCDSTSGCKHETKKCGDNNPCTTDSCNSTSGLCEYLNNAASCEDGDMCKSGDKCSGGSCMGGTITKDCDDMNSCTKDSCSSDVGCKHAAQAGTPCNDGDQTTKSDMCGADGVCAGIKPITPCDDNNACTDDAGDPTSGVPCTHLAVNCDDQNGCTKDTCDKANGCVHTDTSGICTDGDACTVGDKCSSGSCVGGVAPVCNDNNSCTSDTCDPTTGCVFSPTNGVACDDMDSCTTGDQCDAGGTCVGTGMKNCDDGNSCTTDTCDSIMGGCLNLVLSGSMCDDSNPGTVGDVCFAGVCKGNSVACDDGNKCTFDTGASQPNCTHVAVVCDDNNPCTTDSCDPTKGCAFVNNTSACDDGNACTVGEVCSAGTCSSGTGLKCDDQDSCTTDSCDNTGTCSHTSIVGCGTGEVCGNGVDDDGDGKIDCADSECKATDKAYTLFVYAQYEGAMIGFVTKDKPNTIQSFSIPSGKPYTYKLYCAEVPFSATLSTTSIYGGVLQAWVEGSSGTTPDEKVASAPDFWKFDVYWPLPEKGQPVKTKSFPKQNGESFKVSWPPSK